MVNVSLNVPNYNIVPAKVLVILSIFGLFLLSGCDLQPGKQDNGAFTVSSSFDFQTTKTVDIEISAVVNPAFPETSITGALFNGNPEEEGRLLHYFDLGGEGKASITRSLPDKLQELYVRLNYDSRDFLFKAPVLSQVVTLDVEFTGDNDNPVVNSPGSDYIGSDYGDTSVPSHYFAYYPGKGSFGMLMFEDLWPSFGDYDMNDLVMEYQIREKLNPADMLLGIDFTFVIRAVGASYKNGFGISFDELSPGYVASVQGYSHTEEYIRLRANGTEDQNSSAVIIVTDNVSSRMPGFSNVIAGERIVKPDTMTVSVTFTQPINRWKTGFPPYNPFIISDGQRGREIHLANHQPTDLVDATLFNTLDDASNPSEGRFFRSKENLNWAIHIPASIPHPASKSKIYEAYPMFRDWAMSNGEKNKNWYEDLPGHRIPEHLIDLRY